MRVLIVGGGLSGVCLAHQLEQRNVDYKIIDKGKNHSSVIAAGMINPMVFRKMVKTWKGDDLIPYLKTFYPYVESKVGASFFFPRKIRRLFSTPEEAELWKQREQDNNYSDYIFRNDQNTTQDTPDYAKAKHGAGIVNSPGYIDSRIFMKSNHTYFLQQNKLDFSYFDFQQLDPVTASYKGEKYDAIVFSEGYQAKENPYFKYLPLNQTKGEVLIVSSQELRKDEILNRKCFVLPTQDGNYRLGATFDWDTTDVSTTEEGKTELLQQYAQLSSAQLTVLDQEAGIRPTVTDRRPLLGKHPTHERLLIFNGMGTKGYMLAPYFANHFCDHLLNNEKLDEEVDIRRFQKKHFTA